MSFETMLTNAASGAAKFWIGTAQRWKDAKAAGKGYTADNLVADLVGTWCDATDAWTSLLSFGPAPLTPTVFYSDAAGAFVGQQPKANASLTESVPAAAVVDWTPLDTLSGGKQIPKGELDVAVKDANLEVTFKLTAAPAAGLYVAVAYLAPPVTQPPKILAQILLFVT